MATRMALTRENQTVQAPWLEKVLRAIETPRIPEPAQRTSGGEGCWVSRYCIGDFGLDTYKRSQRVLPRAP